MGIGLGKKAGRKARQAEKAAKKAKFAPRRAAPIFYAPPDSNAFLESFEWRRVRMQALKLHGARCQCCGATAADGLRIHVDHIKPRKLFPELALSVDNLQVLCEVCNHGKGNWDQTDWRSQETDVAPEVHELLRSF